MIKIENFVGPSPEQWMAAIRGMRNPKNSWGRLDSSAGGGKGGFSLGANDKNLARGLCLQGREHRKFLRQLPVIMDITAPIYWWRQMDQYKIGTVTDSCSQMHTLLKKPFQTTDFSFDGMSGVYGEAAKPLVDYLNRLRDEWLKTENESAKKTLWVSILQLLPQSHNQRRTFSANYEVLRTICRQREGHKLSEWADFIQWVRENVPYAEELVFRCGAEKRGGAE